VYSGLRMLLCSIQEQLNADINFCCFKLYKMWHFGKSHNHKYLNKWWGTLKSVLVR